MPLVLDKSVRDPALVQCAYLWLPERFQAVPCHVREYTAAKWPYKNLWGSTGTTGPRGAVTAVNIALLRGRVNLKLIGHEMGHALFGLLPVERWEGWVNGFQAIRLHVEYDYPGREGGAASEAFAATFRRVARGLALHPLVQGAYDAALR